MEKELDDVGPLNAIGTAKSAATFDFAHGSDPTDNTAPDSENITGGGYFEVPANSSFNIIVNEPTDYCCTYIK